MFNLMISIILPVSSTMYTTGNAANSEDSGSNQSIFSVGLSPIRPETPSPSSFLSRTSKYTRRPLHPPNANYANSGTNSLGSNFLSSPYSTSTFQPSAVNGFSDDEIDDHHASSSRYRYTYKPMSIFSSARTKTTPYSPGEL